jgi:Ca-activated chloride channel homolog
MTLSYKGLWGMFWRKTIVLGLIIVLGAGSLLSGCSILAPKNTMTVLAGSELSDLEPIFDQIRRNTGISLEMHYTGTLDGAQSILSGEKVDLAWFSHAKYLTLLAGAQGKVLPQERIMLSPVVMGVKQSKAEAWGWANNPDVTWRMIVAKANSGELHFAMTNPTSSNSGFTALVGAASALSGSADALRLEDIDRVSPDLAGFFKGQVLTAGSSGWLADQFVAEQDHIDGIVNYESVLLGLNKSGKLHEKLTLIYPKEGIITADYPLILVNQEKRADFDKLVTYLRTPEFQKMMMEKTLRRPVISQVPLSADFTKQLLVELPFPNNQTVIDKLLFAYLDKQSLPSHPYFVLDTSGSMEGDRINSLETALNNLTGLDTSLTGQFARFRDREHLTILTFSDDVNNVSDFEIDTSKPASQQQVRDDVNALVANGNTAIYSALQRAYELALKAKQQDPNRYYSVVLMTDGENNSGISWNDFKSFYQSNPDYSSIKTFTILFGDANIKAMQDIANFTGGKVFDAKAQPLNMIFKQIRGYQ